MHNVALLIERKQWLTDNSFANKEWNACLMLGRRILRQQMKALADYVDRQILEGNGVTEDNNPLGLVNDSSSDQ